MMGGQPAAQPDDGRAAGCSVLGVMEWVCKDDDDEKDQRNR